MTIYANKVDVNQAAIVSALRAVGATVIDFSWAGRGVPDLHVYHCERMYWMEVKRPRPANSKAKDDRTAAELGFARQVPVFIVRAPAEALAVLGVKTA